MSLSHASDSSNRPGRRRFRLVLALLIFALFGGQASVAVEVKRGLCPTTVAAAITTPTPGTASSPCYTAELPGAGWWWIEVVIQVDRPFRRSPERPHLFEARFELLLAVDRGGRYRVCHGDLPPGATVDAFSSFLPATNKAGDPDEIELEPDPSVSEPIAVALVPCAPSKAGDPDEIELEPDP